MILSCGNLIIKDNYSINTVTLGSSTSGTISDCQIESLKINASTLSFTNVDIGDLEAKLGNSSSIDLKSGSIDKMTVSGSPTKFDLIKTTISEIEWAQLHCPPNSYMLSVNVLAYWQIRDSDLHNLTISNCNFSKMKLLVENTDLSNTHFDAVNWPNRAFIQDNRQKDGFPKKDRNSIQYKNAITNENIRTQHLYRQLKHSAEKDNDKINYQKFKAFELDRYMRTLVLFSKDQCAEKVALSFGRYTNFFGLWWFRPLILYFLFSFVLFYFVSGFNIVFFSESPCNSLESDFMRFLNPTHDMNDFEFVNTGKASVIFLDYLTRIIQGLMAYQVIRGFRKPFF